MTPAFATAGAALGAVDWAELAGWARVDLAPAWAVFRAQAIRIAASGPELRIAAQPDGAFRQLCQRASAMPGHLADDEARRFFERAFQPFRIRLEKGGDGFMTGYYEPVVNGALTQSAAFRAPILPRPDDLHTFEPHEHHPAIPPGYSAGRLSRNGMEIYPDRADLEAFAITADASPVVWLRDWTEVYLIHVQGSARVKLTDGSEHRLVYAGRNGHPYTSIGRRLIETGLIAQAEMSLAALKSWLRQNAHEARALMHENRSYIFFRMEPIGGADHGPIGGAGLPLSALKSIAVDRGLWSYGLPFWIESAVPVPGFGPDPMARLFIAEDTGSAIVGPARADLFLGSGDQAGALAGAIRHSASFTVLLPRTA